MNASAIASILNQHIDFNLSPSGHLRAGRSFVKPHTFIMDFMASLPPEARREILASGADLSDMGLSSRTAKEIIKGLEAAADVPVDASQIRFNDVIPAPMSEIQFIINTKSPKSCFLYWSHEGLDYFDALHHDFILNRAKAVLGKDGIGSWLSTNALDCEIGYSPIEERIFWPSKHQRVFNTYKEPSWRCRWEKPTGKVEIPAVFKSFMEALFPQKTDQGTVAAWLRDCVFARAEPILVLSGSPGVGKNILAEHIGASLVGINNYRSATRGFGKSYFHNGVSQCRLFLLDEMNLTHDARESLKAYHNGKSTIERKGIDAGDPEQIFASFVVANNYPQYIKLEYSDRKFYVPELTVTPLRDSIGQEKIDELIACLKREDFLKDLAGYLFTKFKPGQSSKFKKNEVFKQLCLNSYPPWFQMFISACAENSELTSVKFNKGAHKRVDPLELQQQCDHYRVNFGVDLCEIETIDHNKWVVKSRTYRPELNGLSSAQGFDALAVL